MLSGMGSVASSGYTANVATTNERVCMKVKGGEKKGKKRVLPEVCFESKAQCGTTPSICNVCDNDSITLNKPALQ